jgi:hypothetical protein
MVHSDGSVLAEFADGKDLPSRMNSRILFSAQRAALTGLYSYSTQDPKQRELAYQLLRELPGEGQGRERQLTPGYYEVALAKDSNAGALRPLFFDYRRHPFFLGTGGT